MREEDGWMRVFPRHLADGRNTQSIKHDEAVFMLILVWVMGELTCLLTQGAANWILRHAMIRRTYYEGGCQHADEELRANVCLLNVVGTMRISPLNHAHSSCILYYGVQ